MQWTRRAAALMMALIILLSCAAAASELEPIVGYDPAQPEILSEDHLYAQSVILIDAQTGTVLFEKNADRQMSPASTTKIMTCMLALEHFAGDLDQYVTIPAEAGDLPDGSSVVPVRVGEQMTVRDLLFGLMLHSGNDAAIALAVLVSGDEASFVELMNQRAQELGCTNTHFVNPHGYTAEGHYTSVRDMAMITQAAMQNETFRNIVKTMKYTMAATNARSALILTNTNLWGASSGMYKYKYGNGVKTGFTSAAGQCLVGSATNDEGLTLISVVFRSTTNNAEAKWLDSTKIMDYGFSRYDSYLFDQLYEMAPLTVQIENAAPEDPQGGTLRLNAQRITSANVTAVLLDTEVDSYLTEFAGRFTVEYSSDLKAPIVSGARIGTLTYTHPDGTVVTAMLTAERGVEAARSAASDALRDFFSSTPSWILTTLAVLVLALFVLWRISVGIKKREKRRRRIERARRKALQQKKLQQAQQNKKNL